jgi:hypothetical protein
MANAFIPKTLDEVHQMAELLALSGMVPKSFLTKEGKPNIASIQVAIIMGMSLGIHPLQAVQNICVINGMPAVWGDLALALVKTHPDYVEVIEERIEGGWQCTSKRRGRTVVVRTFTLAEAKRSGLIDKPGPWKTYPDRMIQMRARGFSIRDQFPDALKGLRIAEEIIDVEATVVDETPAERLTRRFEETLQQSPPQPVVEPASNVNSDVVEEPAPAVSRDVVEQDDDTGPSEAEVVLTAVIEQLTASGYAFSMREKKRLGELKTDEELVKAIQHYRGKLAEMSAVMEDAGETNSNG